MTIKAERYTKDGIETTLEYGVGRGQYYIVQDGIVLAQCSAYRPVWAKGQEARTALVESGWESK